MYPGVELRLLRYVIAVAEELHFSRAAAKVCVAQPSLSKQIRDLEDEIGTRLFDRTSHGVRLTAAGRVFVKQAGKALTYSDRAVQLARKADPAKDGQLRLGYTPRMNMHLLSAIRRLLREEHGSMQASFHSLSTAEQAAALLEGSLSAGVITMPFHYESLAVEHLLREPLVAALNENLEVTGSRHLKIANLAAIPLICRARRLNAQSHDHFLKKLRKLGYAPVSIVEVTSDEEALHLVNEGLGVAFVKASALPSEATRIPIFCRTDAELFEDTGLAYRRSNRAKNVRDFLQALRKQKGNLAGQSLEHPNQTLFRDRADAKQLKLF